MIGHIHGLLTHSAAHRERTGRPFVTLTYAQSLDGSIAGVPGERLYLSDAPSLVFTHQLRAAHRAILVGIGTVLADDPSLTVRLTDGPNPQVIVVDSSLRLPLSARVLRNACPPWVATTPAASFEARRRLQGLGATIVTLPATAEGRVDLHALLDHLGAQGVDSVMVEGGSRIITSFLAHRLVDQLVVTVAPVLVGGLRAVNDLLPVGDTFPRLRNVHHDVMGRDLVLRAEIDW
ncbi:MAG: RibD family protein [Dehalococcoidia bacterium]|nr:RibD family protein [Dehalococcoidia bacterium]